MQKGKINVTGEDIFPIIKKFLYSDHEIFLRELVSNAVDATQKLKILSSKGKFDEELGDLTIRVNVDKDAGTITISDKGIGMTADEVDKYIYMRTNCQIFIVFNRVKMFGNIPQSQSCSER